MAAFFSLFSDGFGFSHAKRPNYDGDNICYLALVRAAAHTSLPLKDISVCACVCVREGDGDRAGLYMSIPKLVHPVTTHTYTQTHEARVGRDQPADVLDCGDPISSCIPLFKKRERGLFNSSLGSADREILTAIERFSILRGLAGVILARAHFFPPGFLGAGRVFSVRRVIGQRGMCVL